MEIIKQVWKAIFIFSRILWPRTFCFMCSIILFCKYKNINNSTSCSIRSLIYFMLCILYILFYLSITQFLYSFNFLKVYFFLLSEKKSNKNVLVADINRRSWSWFSNQSLKDRRMEIGLNAFYFHFVAIKILPNNLWTYLHQSSLFLYHHWFKINSYIINL